MKISLTLFINHKKTTIEKEYDGRYLDLSNLEITSLEDTKFPIGLRSLDICNNLISTLIGVVFPSTLKRLDCFNNKIETIEGVNFPNLSHLYMSRNNISHLNCDHLPRSLFSVNLARNNMKTIEGVLPPPLEYINISCNLIETVDKVTFPLNISKCLDIDVNKITSIPRSFLELKKLTLVAYTQNPIEHIDHDVKEFLDPIVSRKTRNF